MKNMSLLEFVQEAHTRVDHIDAELRYAINATASRAQWVELAEYFVNNIGFQRIAIPQVIYKMDSICAVFRKHKAISHKQCLYLSNNLLDHWGKLR